MVPIFLSKVCCEGGSGDGVGGRWQGRSVVVFLEIGWWATRVLAVLVVAIG